MVWLLKSKYGTLCSVLAQTGEFTLVCSNIDKSHSGLRMVDKYCSSKRWWKPIQYIPSHIALRSRSSEYFHHSHQSQLEHHSASVFVDNGIGEG